MQQYIHFHSNREEWEQGDEILEQSKTKTKHINQSNPKVAYLMTWIFISKDQGSSAFVALFHTSLYWAGCTGCMQLSLG